MLNASSHAQNLVASYNGKKVSEQSMTIAQNIAKESTIGLTIAQTALNSAIGMGIGLLVNLAIEGISTLIHANDNAINKADELRKKYEDFKSTNENNVATLKGLETEFNELSKGVSQYGDNISLTTEQYKRYKEIIQQIIGISPSLSEGYSTENGYIADKTGLLERAINLQEQEYRNELRKITNLDNLKTSMSGYIAEYKEALNGGTITSKGNVIGTPTDTDFKNALWQLFNTNNRDNFSAQDMAKEIIKSLGTEDVDAELQKYFNKYGYWQDNLFWNDYCDKIIEHLDTVTNPLSPQNVGLDESTFNQNLEKLKSYAGKYNDMKDSIQMANNSIQTDLGYIAEYADGYSELSTEQQKFVADFLKGFNITDISSENIMGSLVYDEDKMASVKSQITDFVENLSQDKSTKNALANLYAVPTDEQSISEFVQQFKNALNIIKTYCSKNGINIPIAISDNEQKINNLETQHQNTVDFVKDKFDGYDPTIFFKQHSINTQEELDAWQEIAKGARNASEAEKEYIQNSILNNDTPALSFTDAWDSLDSTEDESLKSLKEELLSLAEAGKLTVESFKNTNGSDSFLSQLGINKSDTDKIEDVVDTVNKLASSADRLASVKTDLNSLSENLSVKEQNPGAAISSDALSGMDDGLKEQTEEWNNYVAIMSSASSSAAEAEQATANLAAARTAETLGLNELNFAKAESVNQTYGEISALMSEGEISGLTAAALFNLIATEQIFANQSLNASGKIAELERLALAFGIVSDSGGLAAEITDKINLMTRAGRSTESINREVQNTLDSYSSGIQDQIRDRFGSVKSSPSGSAPKGGGSSGASQTAKPETTETFNFIETAISRAEKAIERLKETAKDAFTGFQSRAKAYGKAISQVSDEIAVQQQAYDTYMANANSAGLDESLASQVRDGSLNIEYIKDDGTKEKIKQYQEWYEKALKCSDALYDLRKQQKELVRESIELVITKYDKKISNSKSQSERTEKRISLRESMGLSVGTKSYGRINNQNIHQIGYYRKQNQELRKLQKTVPKNLEAWLEYNNRMKENNNTVIDLKKNIVETAKAAAALAGQAAALKVEKLDSKNDLLDAKSGNAVPAGTKNGYIDSKIKNIGKQQAAYDKAVTTDDKNIKKSKRTLLKFKSTKANKKLLAEVKKCVKSGKRISNKLLKKVEQLFTNIQNQWDNAVYQNEQKETSLNNSMEINRGNGNKRLNQKVYASLITNEEAKRNNLISLFSKPISFIFFQSQTLNPIQHLVKFL